MPPTILANCWVKSACAFNIEANQSIWVTRGDDANVRCPSPLLASPAQLTETERRRLITIWYRTNVVRLIAVGGSAAALARLGVAE
jgi:hypothetical protein